MSVIPRYFCDHCGLAFQNPENRGKGWYLLNDKDEDDFDERCPRCGNPDFELLVIETSEKGAAVAMVG